MSIFEQKNLVACIRDMFAFRRNKELLLKLRIHPKYNRKIETLICYSYEFKALLKFLIDVKKYKIKTNDDIFKIKMTPSEWKIIVIDYISFRTSTKIKSVGGYTKLVFFLKIFLKGSLNLDDEKDFLEKEDVIREIMQKNKSKVNFEVNGKKTPTSIKDFRNFIHFLIEGEDNRMLFYVSFLYVTGLRFGEALRLRKTDITFNKSTKHYDIDISGKQKISRFNKKIQLSKYFYAQFQEFFQPIGNKPEEEGLFGNFSKSNALSSFFGLRKRKYKKYAEKKSIIIDDYKNMTLYNMTRKRGARDLFLLNKRSASIAKIYLRHSLNSTQTDSYIFPTHSIMFDDTKILNEKKYRLNFNFETEFNMTFMWRIMLIYYFD